MGETAVEDKKTVATLESKARDLQAKIVALLNIEKVSSVIDWNYWLLLTNFKDVRVCLEQLQTTEKEVLALEVSHKQLASLKDNLDDKKIECSELHLKREVVLRLFKDNHG